LEEIRGRGKGKGIMRREEQGKGIMRIREQ
jgi:hypothetical protein